MPGLNLIKHNETTMTEIEIAKMVVQLRNIEDLTLKNGTYPAKTDDPGVSNNHGE